MGEAGPGRHQHQAAHAFGGAQGQLLRDHAAHGNAHHDGRVDARVVEHRPLIVSHVPHRPRAGGHVRASGAAVVGHDDLQAPVDQQLGLVDPHGAGHAEAVHQQHRRSGGIAEAAVVDPIALRTVDVGHQQRSAASRSAASITQVAYVFHSILPRS